MKKSVFVRSMSLLLTLIMLFGVLPTGLVTAKAAEADLESEVITIDFISAAAEAAKQSWWNELRIDSDTNVHYQGYSGYADIENTTAEQKVQYQEGYASLRSWLNDTYGWSIDENISLLNNTGRMKRMMFNGAADAKWGVRMRTTFPTWGATYHQFRFTVEVETAGTYGMKLTYLQGGGTFGVSVNGASVASGISTAGGSEAFEMSLGTMELTEGTNTVDIFATSGVISLNSISFIPYSENKTIEVEQGMTKATALKDLFLDPDESYKLVSDNERICIASIDAGGNVVIRGITQGEATVTVEQDGEVLYTFYVTVVERNSEVHIPKTIDIDLISFDKKAVNQPWWEDLAATNLTGVKAVGANYYNVVPEEQAAAFDAMQAYTRENEGWFFSDGNPIIGTY